MASGFDYKQYWKRRLANAGDKLTGVGHQRFNDRANNQMYKKAFDSLERVIKEYKVNLAKKTILDAGAGIGIFSEYYLKKGAKVIAIDLSKDALSILKKKFPTVTVSPLRLDEIGRIGRKVDIVHCFDVLYHIVDDKEWKRSIEALARQAKEYVIVHDKYPYFGYSIFEKGHVKVRKPEEMRSLLKKEGFEELPAVPTHVLFVRPIFYPLVNTFPEGMAKLDNVLADSGFSFLKTTYVRIFKKVA